MLDLTRGKVLWRFGSRGLQKLTLTWDEVERRVTSRVGYIKVVKASTNLADREGDAGP